MNIERITEEVTRELLAELHLEQAAHSPLVPYQRILFVFSRADIDLNPVAAKLSRWKDKAQLRLVAPKWAGSLWSGNPLTQAGLTLEHTSFEATAAQIKSLVDQADRIVLLGTNLSIVNKILRTQRDHLAAGVVVEGLARNKPVMVLDSDLSSEHTRKLQALGLHLGKLDDIERVFPLPPLPVTVTSKAPAPANLSPEQAVNHSIDRIRQLINAGAQRVATALGEHPVPSDLARMIDHTLLKAEATEEQVRKLCAEAREYTFASVCVNPSYVALAAQLLKGCPVMVCTVIGFPLGATDSKTKADETRNAIANGADEIDMVINVGALKSRNLKAVEADIRAVVQAAAGKTVKVILETSMLNDEEKVIGCQLSEKAGAHFVKTATGFGPGGATENDVALMRRTVRREMEVKASGSIRDTETAMKMVRAGATRIGASASIAIVTGKKDSSGGKY
jgi:deoxyribose-phosphate aldolase